MAIFVLAILLSISNYGAAASYDEVFSAVNCAELPAFQTISYYMIPNNHVYFNFINHFLCMGAGDAVQSGRLISFVAYTGVLFCAFYGFNILIKKRWLAFIALLPVALQFATWGFATQARGYESQLMCGWVSVISMIKYAQNNNKNALRINTLFNILGIAFVPTFLYTQLAEALFISCIMAYKRVALWDYLKYQVMFFAFAFLLYLPAFCFSGVAAFTNNPFVTPGAKDLHSYIPMFIDFSKYMINFCFSMIGGENNPINFVLFFFPLLLFFSKQKEQRAIALFYTLFWIVFILFTLNIRRQPFIRNMIIHYSLTMAAVVYTFYVITDLAAQHIKKGALRYGSRLLWIVPVILFCCFLYTTDRENVSMNLYFNDVNGFCSDHRADISSLPAGSSIAFSDESFYFYYLGSKMHFKASKCANGSEDFYIKRTFEPLPPNMANEYVLASKFKRDYELYKRK